MHGDALSAFARQAAKFGVVGVGNTLLSLVVYTALARVGLPGPAAAALAFVAGAANGYVWNRRWTFAADDSHAARVRYLIVQACGLGLTSALVWSGERAGLGSTVAYLATVVCVTAATFLANRAWTFAPRVTGTSQATRRVAEAAPRTVDA